MDSESFSKNEVIQGEIEIMKSAYANEFEELSINGEDASTDQQNLQVRFKLGPHHTRGGTLYSHVCAVVKIATTFNYPDEPAEVTIETCSGITDKEKNELEIELKKLCLEYSKLSTVVMMEICLNTQSFLGEHARPYVESVYDEMIASQKAKEKALLQAEAEVLKEKEKQDEERRILIKEEMERIQEAMKKERRERREKMKRCSFKMPEENEEETKSPVKRRSSRSASECSGDSSSNEKPSAANVTFTSSEKRELNISPLANLGERQDQFCTVTLGRETRSKELFVMYTWAIRPKKIRKAQEHDYILEDFLSKLYSSEKEMSSLLKLSHENLVPFEAMKVIKPQTDYGYIHILQEYVQGHSLKVYFDLRINLPESLIHHIASGVGKALDYLHSNNVVHRNIRDSCVFLDHEYHIVRLADYGVERRCVESIMEYEDQEPPSLFPSSPGRGGKKCDVFRFGLLLLSLTQGKRITEVAPKIPTKLSSKLQSFLSHCLDLSEHERWTSHQLVDHPFILNYVPEEDSVKRGEGLNNAKNHCLNDSSEGKNEAPIRSFEVSSSLKAFTRFHDEYDFMEWLGKGGFGHVYKVRNKVDDRVYALKQIPLHHKSDSTRRKMIREVKLLSSLNHENVVRYYTSWIESIALNEHMESRESFLNSLINLKEHSLEESGNYEASFIESETEEGDRDWLMPVRRISTKDEESDEILFVDSSKEDDPKSSSKDNDKKDDDDHDDELSSKPSINSQPKRIQYLFIQMQYCEKNTLRQAIDHGLHLDEDRVWRLFRELINGLDYIHSQGLIHRDLKPGNIFLDSSDYVKIGDFGLATVAFKVINADNNSSQVNTVAFDLKDSSALTGHVGTTLYIAPELTKILGKVSYTNKVDIYSLGIIFFEMVYPFSTGMERVKLLSSLRIPQPQFPDDFSSIKQQKLILWLLTHDVTERPSTKELLTSPLLPPPTEEEQKFMTTLDSKIKNVNSKDYQDILKLLFKPAARPELEATFEFYMQKLGPKRLLSQDFVKNQVINIFRSHGAICVPTSFYIPRGSFYQNKENIFGLMTRGGEMLTAQFELRYPFARYIARSDIKHLRRYSIDRVQRALKISGVHPIEIFECAFDIIAPKHDLAESCSRVILVAQDILLKVSGFCANEVTIKLCHSELTKLILNYCGVKEEEHDKVIELLYDFRAQHLELEQLGKCLRSMSIGKRATEMMKDFYRIEGSVDDICITLQTKMLSSSSRRRDYETALLDIIAQINELKGTILDMGIQFEVVLHPFMVVDHGLYKGISFQLLLKNQDKKSTANILAQGGEYEHLIAPFRGQNLSTKRLDIPLSAVGISLPLDRVEMSVDLKRLNLSIEEARLRASQGQNCCDLFLTELFICAVEERQLKERVTLTSRLAAENIAVDHGFAMGKVEAEALSEDFGFIPHFVFIYPDKVILRSNDNSGPDRSAHFNDRKINHNNMFEFLCKLCRYGKGNEMLQPCSSSNPRRESFKYGNNLKPEEFTPNIEYLLRKQTRPKDQTKLDDQITDEVASYIFSRCSYVSVGDSVEVFVLDVNKKVLLALGQLDVETTVKNFNDSATDIMNRFPDIKDYLDRICKAFMKSIFYKKKSDRPNIILCYSISAECLKRIY